MTYSIGGTQYVAQLAGYGGGGFTSVADQAAVKFFENTGRLIVYKLGGGPVPTPARRNQPIGPPKVDNTGFAPLSPAQLKRGEALFGNCSGCHSTAGGTPILPNLGRVRDIGKDTFKQIVLKGALMPYGMPSFAGQLSDRDADVLYEYISRGYHNQPVPGSHWK
jgi:quinohemoprotein ethanol dehydrogenase